MTACRELEQEFGLRNSAEMQGRELGAELKKVDASAGDVRHQVGSTLKAVLAGYRFQTFGEYSALLSTLNIEAKLVRGEYGGRPYTGIVYAATDDNGKVASPPFKSSRFGKRFGKEGLDQEDAGACEGLQGRPVGTVHTAAGGGSPAQCPLTGGAGQDAGQAAYRGGVPRERIRQDIRGDLYRP